MNTKKRKSSKYIFTLKNVDTDKIDKRYSLKLISNITNINCPLDNITKLSELIDIKTDKEINTFSFLDETKRLYHCNISIIDFNTGKMLDNNSRTKYNCYWCRNYFNFFPIGCPINYESSKITKNYHSEVSKDDYIIKENITKDKLINTKNIPFIFTALQDKKKSNFVIDKKEYYETDGIFCSFNCCKAFIKDNKNDPLYNNSDSLLIKLYNDIFKVKIVNINPAPHWRMLVEYGGHLTINEFRDSFTKITYDCHGVFKPIGKLYESKINF
jgi:hypothetical protein